MSAAPAPFTFSGTLSFPPDPGAPNLDLAVALSAYFTNQTLLVLNLTGLGTKTIDFGTIAPNGAKVLLVEVDPDPSPAAQPVFIQVNGGGAPGQIELPPGGFIAVGSPNPTAAGILSLAVVHATTATVRVRILG